MAETKAGKRPANKVLVIAVAAVVLVAVLAGAGAWFVLRPHPASAKVEEKKADHNDDAPPIYEKMPAVTVNLSGTTGSVMRIEIAMRLGQEKDKERLDAYMPKIQSDLILLYSSKNVDELLTQDGKLKLIHETKDTINHAMGEDDPDQAAVKDVSFTEFIIQ